MNSGMPGLPVLHRLLELGQTHVHWVSDAIHSSHPLSTPSPLALNLVASKIILSILQCNFAVPECFIFNYLLIFTLLITLNPLLILGQLVNSHFFTNFLCAICSAVFSWNYNMIEIRTAHSQSVLHGFPIFYPTCLPFCCYLACCILGEFLF